MKSPLDIDSKAFEPFYDQIVAISGKTQSTSVKGCVFEDDFDEPLSDSSSIAQRKRITVFIPKYTKDGWNYDTPPGLGETLVVTSWNFMPCDAKFAIESIQDFLDSWQIKAREVRV